MLIFPSVYRTHYRCPRVAGLPLLSQVFEECSSPAPNKGQKIRKQLVNKHHTEHKAVKLYNKMSMCSTSCCAECMELFLNYEAGGGSTVDCNKYCDHIL